MLVVWRLEETSPVAIETFPWGCENINVKQEKVPQHVIMTFNNRLEDGGMAEINRHNMNDLTSSIKVVGNVAISGPNPKIGLFERSGQVPCPAN